jgi:hypothetical protein
LHSPCGACFQQANGCLKSSWPCPGCSIPVEGVPADGLYCDPCEFASGDVESGPSVRGVA